MIASEKQGAVTVLTPGSPLTGEYADELRAAADNLAMHGQPMAVLDLSATPLVDSAGLEAVLDARDAVRARGGVLKLAAPMPLVADILTATGVGEHFERFDSAKAAVGSFAR